MLYWVLKYTLLGPWLKLIFRPKVYGLEHVPRTGAAILACNHLSFSDNVVIPLVVRRRRVVFLAKEEYFVSGGLKGRLMRWFFSGLGQIPVDRRVSRRATAALDTAVSVLERGGLFAIFPEGTRSPDSRLHRGKTGVARIALQSGAPVIPVAVVGTDKVQPRGRRLPRIHRVEVHFGRPLEFARYEGMAGNRFVERSLTDQLMYELMLLSGQEYTDDYASPMRGAAT